MDDFDKMNQALQFLYDAGRKARLTANDHAQLLTAATLIREYLDKQRDKGLKPNHRPEEMVGKEKN